MIVLDRLLVSGVKFVLDKLARTVDGELNNPDTLREELLAAEMQLELGQITKEEHAEIEAALLARMRELRGDQGAIGVVGEDTGVEVEMHGELNAPAPKKKRPPAKAARRKKPRR
jgi:hypothetical protein